MNWIKRIAKNVGKPKIKEERSPVERDAKLTEYEISLIVQKEDVLRCPDCGEPLLVGPSGGMCTNFMCEGCEHKFNLCIGFPDRIFWGERI